MDGNAAPVVAPNSIAEVEQLVKRLYQPGSPQVISQINDQLQKLQLSADGWQMADALLGSDDPNVRFFAALTFQVKLNNDGPSLDSATAQTVLSRLISWLVRASHDQSALVCRKLCSALTTYFLRSSTLWTQPILHLVLSLQHGDAVPQSTAAESNADVPTLLSSLDGPQTVALLWFSSTLADEVGRVDPNSPANAQMHKLMETIVPNAAALIHHAFSRNDDSIKSEALKCFLNWVNYAQPVWPNKPEALQVLRSLIEPAAQCLTIESLQRDSLDVFRDILESYTSFFQNQHMEYLAQVISVYIQPVLLQALQDQDPEGLPFGQMVISFGNATVQQIVEDPENEAVSRTILKLHFDILKAPGYPGDDDELSTQSIEFWNTYIEFVNDNLFSRESDEPHPAWLPHTKAVLSQVIELLCAKMVTPPPEVAKDWSSDDSDGFKEFRLDTTDLMLSVYVCLGPPMLHQLVNFALQSLEAKQWHHLEAALFGLNTLADNVLEDQGVEDSLRPIFSSNLFREVADFSQNIPSQTRRTAIDMLGAYGQYIERHAEFLPDTLRFLFASLETTLCNTAAKSISSLCSTCRSSLTGELSGFLQQYKRFLEGPTSDPYTKERVIGAIACIIQALSPESAKVQPLHALLENIENDVEAARRYASAGENDMVEVMGVTALNCLASIGKGLQIPDDVPISLVEDDEKNASEPNFWESTDGQSVQQRIMGCFSVLQVVGNHGEAIEAACQVLRSGFAETEPGPFVLPPSVTVSFVQQCSLGTPQLETVLSTACTLITQHSRTGSKAIDTEVAAICQQTAQFIQEMGKPAQDPGVAQSCIDVFGRLSPRYIQILFDEQSPVSQHLQSVLNFTLEAIEGAEPFPKSSALDFWAKLIKPPTVSIPDSVRERISQVIAAYGPQLTQVLTNQICGLAQRSELDYMCEPLKALITNQPRTKSWLETALFSTSLPQVSTDVGDAERRRFIQQIVGLRGDSRKTKEVVKEFFAACRGTVLSYNLRS